MRRRLMLCFGVLALLLWVGIDYVDRTFCGLAATGSQVCPGD